MYAWCLSIHNRMRFCLMGSEHGIGYTLQLGTSFASALFSSLLIHVHIGVSGIVSCMNLSNEYVFGR